MNTILVSAGDLSGEAHAAELVRALRARLPAARFVGMGGAAMAEAGVEIVVDQRELAVGGIFEVAGSLGRIRRAWRRMIECLRLERPDLVILVDSGGFNLPFARRVRRACDAPILYFVAPQIWAWRGGRLRKLVERTDRIVVVLPFEKDFYAQHDVEVDFVGHPLLDRPGVCAASGADGPESLGDGRSAKGAPRVLGLFPGSRRNEIESHLGIQLEVFERLLADDPDLRAVLGVASTLDPEEVARRVGELAPGPRDRIEIRPSAGAEVLAEVDVALCKAGTITLEALLANRPMVVMGRVHPLTARIARRSLEVDWVSLPNLVAGSEIVPEFIQEEAQPDRIAAALAPLFRGPAREAQREALAAARSRLGEPGAIQRTARIVEEMLGTARA